jgi:predicted nucleic acid-binding protein
MDSDVTISLLKSGTIHVLGGLHGFAFMITESNYAEIHHESERRLLDAAISRGDVSVESLTDPAALQVFAQLLISIDTGEAAVIALAVHLDADVAMHDRAGRRAACRHLPVHRVHRLEDILVEAVREECITVGDVHQATDQLRIAGDYLPEFGAGGIGTALTDPALGLTRGQPRQ